MDTQDTTPPGLPVEGSPGWIQSVVRAMTAPGTIASQGGVRGGVADRRQIRAHRHGSRQGAAARHPAGRGPPAATAQRQAPPHRHDDPDPDAYVAQLTAAARDGCTLDDGEQEIGVRCVAVPVLDAPVRLALSISGPAPRMTPDLVQRAVPLLKQVAADFSADLT